LVIPALELNLPVAGVQLKAGTWNTSWLGNQAGYLEGTSFPTHPGNTVITAHVWDANNQPGPFAKLKYLEYGDQILIKAWGKIYIYQVQENRLVNPSQDEVVFQHEEYDWISLLTCEEWDEYYNQYTYHRLVRAVLLDVIPD
jgi:LPXTG-site transpeptidase (sortase) family protein